MPSFSIEKKEVVPSNLSTSFSTEESNVLEDTEIQSKSIGKDRKNEGQKEYITGYRLYTILLGITVVGFLVMLDQTIMISAIPKISTQFNSLKDIGWYGSVYLLTTASIQPLTGKLYQYHSYKIVFLTCLAFFELGSLVSGVAQSSKMLISGRAIAGIGGAGLMTGNINIIAACAPVDKRPVYMGTAMGLSGVGLVLGPILGGVFTEYASWRWCFFINLPLGGLTALLISLIKIPSSHLEDPQVTPTSLKAQLQRLDLPGFISFIPFITMLLLAVQWGGTTYTWSSAPIIGLLCGTAGSFIIFIIIEIKAGERAMLPLTILCRRKVICTGIVTLLSSGGGLLVAYYLPIWFQIVQGTSPTFGGVHFLPTIGALVFGSVIAGTLVSRIGYFTPFALASCILSALGAGLLTALKPTSPPSIWISFQLIAGIGRGLGIQQNITAIQAALPPTFLPIGTAFVSFIQLLGGTLFISFGQTLFANELKTGLARFAPTVDGSSVLGVGDASFRRVIDAHEVMGVVQAYNWGLTRIFWLGVGAGCVSAVASLGMGWTNIKALKAARAASTEVSQDKV